MEFLNNFVKLITEVFATRWKMFLVCLLIVYWFVSLQLSGMVSSNFMGSFLGPPQNVNSNVNNGVEKVKDLINKIPSGFVLKRDLSLVKSAHAEESKINAKSYIVVDYNTGNVLLEKNSDKSLPVASLTKIMTSVIALDLAHSQELFEVSPIAESTDPTKIGVVAGQRMSLEELLRATLMTSANDAAQVIKEGIDKKYGEGTFIWAMNEKARILGLTNTHFDNPQGFDGELNYSSVEDLAILTHYALSNYPEITEIVKTDYYFLPQDSNHKQFDLYNWNGLLGVYPGVLGVKIGNTPQAGYSIVVVAQRDGKKLLAVLLGAASVLERDIASSRLLDQAFEEEFGFASVGLSESDLKNKYSTWKYWN